MDFSWLEAETVSSHVMKTIHAWFPIAQFGRLQGVLWKAADISDDHLNWIEPLNVVILKACETQSKEEKE